MNILNRRYVTNSAGETKELGARISKLMKPGSLVFLSGGLGSGKTTFTQGFAKGLGIRQFVRSPSFVIASEYASRKAKMYHIDLYRLSPDDINRFGLEEYLYGNDICVVEWAEKFKGSVSPDIEIKFQWAGENKRRIAVKDRRKKPATKM
ncbi:MAG: tRNA (adenosine(37)-N6)-threonylcarbamoyltransferase complex ATPase subunit type 1 TsaE [Elusimicrobiota bacterium]